MEFYCKSGERIHVDILGKGFPIVFLHGNNLQSGYFAKQRVLEKSFKLLFVDSLGHGKSGELQGEASFAYLSDSLDELLSSLSIEKCLLVGHSDGANLALEYAGRHGESSRNSGKQRKYFLFRSKVPSPLCLLSGRMALSLFGALPSRL